MLLSNPSPPVVFRNLWTAPYVMNPLFSSYVSHFSELNGASQNVRGVKFYSSITHLPLFDQWRFKSISANPSEMICSLFHHERSLFWNSLQPLLLEVPRLGNLALWNSRNSSEPFNIDHVLMESNAFSKSMNANTIQIVYSLHFSIKFLPTLNFRIVRQNHHHFSI